MNIGNQYSDMKMYKGIKHYDKVPLFGGDLDESADLQANKLSRIVECLLDSGVLNTVKPIVVDNGIHLPEPLAINIKGDVCIIKNSEDTLFLPNVTSDSGIIYLVGWYQHIVSSTQLKEYGGVDNKDMENELAKNEFNIQSTSRYQFRWDIYSSAYPLSLGSTISISARDSNGTMLGTNYDITVKDFENNLLIAEKPTEMDYAIDDIYILPIIRFTSSGGNLLEAEQLSKIAVSFNYRLEDIYLENIASSNVTDVSNITIDLNVYTLSTSDIIRVTYEGIELSQDTDYTIDYENRRLTLLGFTRRVGEKLKVNITRLVEY